MKIIRTVISLVLGLSILLCNSTQISAETQSILEQPKEKITELLREKLEEITEEDILDIWIVFKSADKSVIETNALNTMNTHMNKDVFANAMKSGKCSEKTASTKAELSNAVEEYKVCYRRAAADVFSENNKENMKNAVF